tara:strand:+ start:34 stop:192 length:159 start_codon:yes stop_codon:yes gene_type:complete
MKDISNLIRDLNDMKAEIDNMNRIIEVIAEQYYDLKRHIGPASEPIHEEDTP